MPYSPEDGRRFENLFVNIEEPRNRKPGLLTYDDREYLLGEKDMEDVSEAQLRQRLRDRIRNGLLDFGLLLYLLEERDMNTIGSSIQGSRRKVGNSEMYRGSEYTIGFIYYLIAEHSSASFEDVLEDAVEEAGVRRSEAVTEGQYRYPEATANVDVTWRTTEADPEKSLEKLRDGEYLNDHEIAALIRDGDLDERDWQRLRTLSDDV